MMATVPAVPAVPAVSAVSAVPAVSAVSAVSAVHEEMHQRARQDEEVWQNAEQMRPVLRQQEEQADEEEPGRGQACFRFPEARPRTAVLIFVLSMIE